MYASKWSNGNLNGVPMEKSATVLTYKVPGDYGGYSEAFLTRWINKPLTCLLTSLKLRPCRRNSVRKSVYTLVLWSCATAKTMLSNPEPSAFLESAVALRKHVKSVRKAQKQSLVGHSGTEPTLPQSNILLKVLGTWSS